MRLIGDGRSEKGDTIIEVVFAIMIFSFVAISSLAIMNQGLATGERTLEITLVRQQINAQAEALRYIHQAQVMAPDGDYAEIWNRFTSNIDDGLAQAEPSIYGQLTEQGNCRLPGEGFRPFVLNAKTAEIWNGPLAADYGNNGDSARSYPPYSQVVYNDSDPTVVDAAYGMWVEAVPSASVTAKRFIDFHIRACWSVAGSTTPMTLGTIVRLYDPR